MSKKLNLNKAIIIQKYINEDKSLRFVAKELNCTKTTLIRYMNFYKIKIRDKYEQHSEIFGGKNNPSFRYSVSRNTLIKYYVKQKKTLKDIGIIIGTTKSTVKKIFKRLKIKTRNRSESQLGLRPGPKNPNWKGGLSFLPYPAEFNKDLKYKIRKRDNFTCQNCGMTETEHLIVYGCNLHTHHIDYNKDNCEENNLTALCNGCNARVNFNRGYWTSFFKNKIGQI